MAEKKCPVCKPGAPEYMNTYGDMMTLLLCFFVLLFAMSSVDSQKFKTVMVALQGSLGVMKGGMTLDPSQITSNTRVQSKGTELKFRLLAKELQLALNEMDENIEKNANAANEGKDKSENRIAEMELNKNYTVTITEKGIKISLGTQMLFSSGKADLRPDAHDIINRILKEIKGLDNEIVVEGHTDNIPINTSKFPSNWELSTTRAVNVLKYMIEKDKTLIGRISAAGYADTQPETTNSSETGRNKNRRVDIIILKSFDEIVSEKAE